MLEDFKMPITATIWC